MLVSEAPLDAEYPAVADASGNAVVTIRTSGNRPWLVSQVTVEMPDAPATAPCVLRKDGAPISPMVPQLDSAGGDPPIPLHPGQAITAEWSGLVAGSRGRVYVVYNLLDYAR